MRIVKKLINPQADLNVAYQTAKLFGLGAFILNIVLAICLIVVSASKDKIIGIDDQYSLPGRNH